jgi:hypothetical protein
MDPSKIGEMMDQYIEAHPYDPNNPSTFYNDTFYNTAVPVLCRQNPDACAAPLSNFCKQFTRDYVVQQVESGNDLLQTLCGCHLPTAQYPYSGWGQNLGCDPVCMYGEAIQEPGEQCSSTVCIMDNITVDIIDSQAGNVTFQNVCSGCGSGGSGTCECWFSNINVNEIQSKMGNIDISSNCGKCMMVPPGGNALNAQQVNCQTFNPIGPSPPPPSPGDKCQSTAQCPQNYECVGGSCVFAQTFIDKILSWVEDNKKWVVLGGIATVVLIFVIILIVAIHHGKKA